MRSSRRRFIQAAGAAAGLASLPGFSQGNPIRVGLVTVKTGLAFTAPTHVPAGSS